MNLPRCCTDLEITLSDLLFPERMSAQGRHFVNVHGLGDMTLAELQANAVDRGDGMVRIAHRCAKLLDNGSCSIYERRPLMCREFDCATRSDCECKGTGRFCAAQHTDTRTE